MLTVVIENRSISFTTKTKAASFIGVSPMTIYRWSKKVRSEKKTFIEYYSKKLKSVVSVYFNSTLIRKNDEI